MPPYFRLVADTGVQLPAVGALLHLALAAVICNYGIWAWALEPTD